MHHQTKRPTPSLSLRRGLTAILGLIPEAFHRRNVPASIDLHEMLRERRQIAHVWAIEDILQVRPDLSDGQAWIVLQQVGDQIDSTTGVTWDTLRDVADSLHPE